MTLRIKIVLALVALATVATVAIGFTSYAGTRGELNRSIDRSLNEAATRLLPFVARGELPNDRRGPNIGRTPGFEQIIVQVIDADARVLVRPRDNDLPISENDRELAASGVAGRRSTRDVTVAGEAHRMLTISTDRGAIQLARATGENQQSLNTIGKRTMLAVLIVAVVAALLGWLIGRQITRRLHRLTAVAGVVASTGRLDVEVPVQGNDEAGQLGRAFSGMLGALSRSKREQQQLVQDAGHELRTPLTSLRTNVSVLRRFDSLPLAAREQLVADLDSETRELTDLVNELVELATDRRDDEPMQLASLGDVAERAAARVRRRTSRNVVVTSDRGEFDGGELMLRPNGIERAVLNLIDNAAKFAPDGPIEVSVVGGSVQVRDHGQGVEPADLPHVFDRFFRATNARSRPGSGLGLAIVRSVVEGHGGTVSAANAPDGGAIIGFTLPGA